MICNTLSIRRTKASKRSTWIHSTRNATASNRLNHKAGNRKFFHQFQDRNQSHLMSLNQIIQGKKSEWLTEMMKTQDRAITLHTRTHLMVISLESKILRTLSKTRAYQFIRSWTRATKILSKVGDRYRLDQVLIYPLAKRRKQLYKQYLELRI